MLGALLALLTVVLGALLALHAVLVLPVEVRAQPAGGWSQAAADPADTNRATVDGPRDPGLKWAVDIEAIVTDNAPQGYTTGGTSAVNRPIIGTRRDADRAGGQPQQLVWVLRGVGRHV